MFLDDSNLIKFDEKVMIYKNFIDNDTVEYINKILYQKSGPQKNVSYKSTNIPWYENKVVSGTLELFDIWVKMSEFLAPEYVLHPQLTISRMLPGDTMFVHEDSPGEDNEHLLTNYDVWSTCTLLDFGVCAYFGEFTGGEVFYPELGIEVSPQPGDLVIHGATSRWKHGVKEVKSGTRFCYSNFSLPAHKNPGTFYNYGTEEYKEITKDGINGKNFYKWQSPIYSNERKYRSLDPEDKLKQYEERPINDDILQQIEKYN